MTDDIARVLAACTIPMPSAVEAVQAAGKTCPRPWPAMRPNAERMAARGDRSGTVNIDSTERYEALRRPKLRRRP